MISGGQSAESQSRPEASRGAVGAEHWSERGQRRIQPGSLSIYSTISKVRVERSEAL
jgi:hypothetical protein